MSIIHKQKTVIRDDYSTSSAVTPYRMWSCSGCASHSTGITRCGDDAFFRFLKITRNLWGTRGYFRIK